jgi:riboflavin synthase
MFTGLVETMGQVSEARHAPPGLRLVIAAPSIAVRVQIGASVSVAGCCLTVVERDEGHLQFDLGAETLQRTTLGRRRAGELVNLERSLCLGDPLGGHLVTGHIDGIGRLERRDDQGEWSKCWFAAPSELMRQMASKASIAVDGVSLTLVDVVGQSFSVALIPHTLAVTTLGQLRVGDTVNLETDILAKYVERQVGPRHAERGPGSGE